jgi:cardiolipin synthase
VDAGKECEIAFLGGINLTPRSVGSPGHDDGRHHDVYVEVSGPAATDVHHNFVQRWNEASERQSEDGRWGHEADDQLPFPIRLSIPRGPSLVQIQRNIHAGLYTDGRASPGGVPYKIADGGRTIFDQYLLAINAAQGAIYIENQAIPVPRIAAALEEALKREVDVVVLVPAEPQDHVRAARRSQDQHLLFDQVVRLGMYEYFSLVGIGARNAIGQRSDIYVHAKIMLVDDTWATIGSCNLQSNSLFGHSELNASIWDPTVVRGLRCALLSEHLGQDTAHLDARAALRLYRHIAGKEPASARCGRPELAGSSLSFTTGALRRIAQHQKKRSFGRYPLNAFRSLLGIGGQNAAPTYEGLYSGEWQHPRCSQHRRCSRSLIA